MAGGPALTEAASLEESKKVQPQSHLSLRPELQFCAFKQGLQVESVKNFPDGESEVSTLWPQQPWSTETRPTELCVSQLLSDRAAVRETSGLCISSPAFPECPALSSSVFLSETHSLSNSRFSILFSNPQTQSE